MSDVDLLFLYLDDTRVRAQLSQRRQRPEWETRRRTMSDEGSGGVGGGVLGVLVNANRRRQEVLEVEQQFHETPENRFATYHRLVTEAGDVHPVRTEVDLPADGFEPGQLYEMHGTLAVDGGGTGEHVPATITIDGHGPPVPVRLARRCWVDADPCDADQVVVFGAGRSGKAAAKPGQALLVVMAIYLPPGRSRRVVGAAATGAGKWLMGRRRALGMLAVAGGAAVAGAWGAGLWDRSPPQASAAPVRVAGGPGEFFDEPDVRAVLSRNGLEIEQTDLGSRQLPELDLNKYDAVFPASAIVARHIQESLGRAWVQYPSFGSPMVVLSWEPIAELLARIGVARRVRGFWAFDVRAYLDHLDRRTRWTDIPGNGTGASGGYPVDQRIVLKTTDPASSNSAAMFIAIAANTLNGGNVVTDISAVSRLVRRIRPCFTDQGHQHATTRFLLEAYARDGKGSVPIGLTYENDAVRQLLRRGDNARQRQMITMYPQPNVLSHHQFIPLTEKADVDRLGDLLAKDPALLEMAQNRFGFRFALENSDQFAQAMKQRRITVPDNEVLTELGIGPVPSNEILGRFIDTINPQRPRPN